MRILVGGIDRHADLGEDRAHGLENFPRRAQAVDCHRLGQGPTDSTAGIERGIGILEHDLHSTAQRAQAARVGCKHVFALEQHGAGIGLDQPQYCAAGGGFSAPGLADEANGFACRHRERHIAHRMHDSAFAAHEAAPGHKRLAEIANLEQRRFHALALSSAARTQQRTWWLGSIESPTSGGIVAQRGTRKGQRSA